FSFTPPTPSQIYPLSLHDALPIYNGARTVVVVLLAGQPGTPTAVLNEQGGLAGLIQAVFVAHSGKPARGEHGAKMARVAVGNPNPTPRRLVGSSRLLNQLAGPVQHMARTGAHKRALSRLKRQGFRVALDEPPSVDGGSSRQQRPSDLSRVGIGAEVVVHRDV